MEAKAKIFFDVCRLIFDDLFCLLFVAFAPAFVWCEYALNFNTRNENISVQPINVTVSVNTSE